jgi:membrane-bound ClpP family serine protease
MTYISIIVGLILAAMVLILFDFLTGTLGLLATLALAALIGAVWLGFAQSAALGLAVLVVVVPGLPVYIFALIKFLPRTRWGSKLFVPKVPPSSGSGTPAAADFPALVGKAGLADTLLRPAGFVRVAGQRVQARAEMGFIEKGSAIMVVSAEGFDVVVRKIDQPAGLEPK